MNTSLLKFMGGCAIFAAMAFPPAGYGAEPKPAAVVKSITPVPRPADIVSASLHRVDNRYLAARVETRGAVPSRLIRLLLKPNARQAAHPKTGAQLMIEGPVVFEPTGPTAWPWSESSRVACVAEPSAGGRQVTWFLLPEVSSKDGVMEWAVETLADGTGSTVSRSPASGMNRVTVGNLPPMEMPRDVAPALKPADPAVPGALSPDFPRLMERYDWESATQPDPAFFSITVPGGTPAIMPISMNVKDIHTGATAPLTPERESRDGDLRRRWEGTALDVKWTALLERGPSGEMTVTVELQSDAPRAISWEVSCALPPGEWSAMDMNSSTALPVQRQKFPFEVIASRDAAVVVQVDSNEPRAAFLSASGAPLGAGAWCRMALTPRTLKFPGRATASCAFRAMKLEPGASPMRVALADLYLRGTLWGGANDPKTAFEARPIRVEVSPWEVQLPWPVGWPRTEAAAQALLRFHAGARHDATGAAARAALLAGARRTDGGLLLEIGDALTPYGIRLPVSADPDVMVSSAVPVSPGMRLIQALDEAGPDPSKVWMVLNGIGQARDENASDAAFAAADHPATCRYGDAAPVLRGDLAAVEAVRALATRDGKRRPVLVARDPDMESYAALNWMDAILLTASRWAALDGDDCAKRLEYLRILAGPRRILFEDDLAADDPARQKLMQRAIGYGVGWTGGAPRAGDRLMIALMERISAAGWEPWGPARASTPDVRIECYGSGGGRVRHAVVINESSASKLVEVELDGITESVALTLPLTGDAQIVEPGEGGAVRLRIPLAAGAVAIADWFPPSVAESELKFLRATQAAAAQAAADNLEGALTTQRGGLRLDASLPAISIKGSRNTAQICLKNIKGGPAMINRVAVRYAHREEILLSEPQLLAEGQGWVWNSYFGAEDAPDFFSIEVQAQRGKVEAHCVRRMRPDWTPMIELRPDAEQIVCAGTEATLGATLLNHSRLARTVELDLEGVERPPLSLELAAESERRVELAVAGREGGGKEYRLRVRSGSETLAVCPVQIKFLDAVAGALSDSRTAVTVSSSEPGFSARAVADDHAETSWTSALRDVHPTCEIKLTGAVRASGVRLKWPYVAGRAQTPRKFILTVKDELDATESFEKVPEPAGETEVEFAPRRVKSVLLSLAPAAGPEAAPDRLWVAEVQLK